MALFQAHRYDGTYNQVPKIEWSNLQAHEFGEPNWVAMYPINSKSGQPSGVLPPRLACKLFHDGIYLINKAEENPKFYQDRLPECCIKFYKKKQFRKQCIEAGKRVICRLARGMGIAPNCVADEIFMYVVLKDAFDLGWRRIAQHIENIPETEKDKDYGRILRLIGGDDISYLYRNEADAKPVKEAKVSKEAKAAAASSKVTKSDFADMRNWFRAYEPDHLHDHDIVVV